MPSWFLAPRWGFRYTPRPGIFNLGIAGVFSFQKIRGRSHIVNLSRIPIGLSSPREAHPPSWLGNGTPEPPNRGVPWACVFNGEPCSGRCEAVPPCDPRHSSGLLQAFGSLLMGLWGLAGSRGPQPRLALVSLASLVVVVRQVAGDARIVGASYLALSTTT